MLTAKRPDFSGERYDLADFLDARLLTQITGKRFDSTDTLFFLRDLTQVMVKSYDIKYPDLIARQLLPVNTSVNPGADTFVWRQYDKRGTAKPIDSYAEDWPNVDVSGEEFESRLVSFGASYQYSFQDVRAAAFAQKPLEQMKAVQARRALEQALEQVAAFGIQTIPGGVQQGLFSVPTTNSTTDYLAAFGLTNFPNILNGNGAGQTSNDWTNPATSVTTILADVNKLQKSIVTNSKGVHRPNTLLLGTATWAALSTVARSPTFTDDSVLQFIMKQSPWLKNVFYWPMLDTAGLKQDGSTPGERVMVLERSPEIGELIISQEFETLPPQLVGGVMKFPCHMRFGGVNIRYPKAIAYMDGAAG